MTYRRSGMSGPEQALLLAKDLPTPIGSKNLHYAFREGEGRWIVRTRRNSLCGTRRCRMVIIQEDSKNRC